MIDAMNDNDETMSPQASEALANEAYRLLCLPIRCPVCGKEATGSSAACVRDLGECRTCWYEAVQQAMQQRDLPLHSVCQDCGEPHPADLDC